MAHIAGAGAAVGLLSSIILFFTRLINYWRLYSFGAGVSAAFKAVFTVKLLTDAPADLTLEYRRPWEKDTPPARTVYYAIIPKR